MLINNYYNYQMLYLDFKESYYIKISRIPRLLLPVPNNFPIIYVLDESSSFQQLSTPWH